MLKKHLKKKLETLKSSEIFLIVFWLVDIYQNKLTLQREWRLYCRESGGGITHTFKTAGR